MGSSAPLERQLLNLRDVSDDVIRLFFRADWFLQLELTVEKAGCVHPEFLASAYLARWAIADDKDLAGIQPHALLNFAEGCFFCQHVITVSKIDLLDGRLAVQSQSLHFCMLDLRLAKADNEIFDAGFGQKAQQGQ